MTREQERMVNHIREDAKERFFYSDEYEFKKWEVTETKYFVAVVFCIGMKGDEGTLASIICRDQAQLFIGKRGGVTYPVSKQLKNGEYRHYTKRLTVKCGRINLYTAVIDQKI